MAERVTLSEIPTLSSLYQTGRIPTPEEPAESTESIHAPNATFNDQISVIRQDITTLAIDAIVNAANNSLLGGGGVDGAIHRAAGPDLYDECETLGGCETGSAKMTDGYELHAKKVIHAVGPIYWSTKYQGREAELLGGCYRKSLELAVDSGLKSIAFSALSTGVYGYPSGEASQVALGTVRKFLDEGKGEDLERVIFCNFMEKDEDAYFKNISKYFPPVIAKSEPESEQGTTREPTEENPSDSTELLTASKVSDSVDDDFVVLEKEEVEEAKDAEAEAKSAVKAEP